MYCSKCGAQNTDGVKFCKNCGTPFVREEEKQMPDIKQPEKKKTVYFIIGGVVLFLAVIAAIFIGMQSKKTKEYESYLETAEKYVVELDYEQAKEYYLKAIEIAPKKLEPYVGIAEIYVTEGEVEKAKAILEKAEEVGAKTEDEEIILKKENIIANLAAYEAYAAKIYEYEEKYGIAEVKWLNDWYTYVSGLSFIKLIDFDQNGQEELLLVYGQLVEEYDYAYVSYQFDIWGFVEGELVLLEKGDELFGTDGGMSHIYLTEHEGKTYLVTGGTDGFEAFYYHNYLDTGDFGIVKREECGDYYSENPICVIDGRKVSIEEYDKEHAKWFENVTEYFLNYEDASMTLAENEKTKDKLYPYYQAKNVEKKTEKKPEKNTEKNVEKKTENKETPVLNANEIYEKLVAHYAKGTEDCAGDEMTVMEGDIYDGDSYETTVRCGVPGNPSATQMLYEVIVDVETGEVTQIRRLTDDQIVKFNLYDE